MRISGVRLLLLARLALPQLLAGQAIPPPGDTRHSLLRDVMLGLLPPQPSVTVTEARGRCLTLPVEPADDRILGPHGDSLLVARCEAASYAAVDSAPGGPWSAAEYHWTSIFTAEDSTRGPAARDTAVETEVVLFRAAEPGRVRAAWHARFDTSPYAIWRSITPEIASPDRLTTILSVSFCVNGTGGCGQEFLRLGSDGRWSGVWQVWLDQLPAGYLGRILHGAEIDPTTLTAKAGFYGKGDANCCPAELLRAQLALEGDSLVLKTHRLEPIKP